MCGLVCAISMQPVKKFVEAVHSYQNHRGPDGEGFFFEESLGAHLGMAHQRLAIVGLSDAGMQPMLSASGRYRILFNGEIYNFRELASQYGINCQSGTDTEVVVELIEMLGIDKACQLFNGMWAMVVQDIKANRFFISRDRFGKKPLYFHHNSDGIYITSEMHSLLAIPDLEVLPNPLVAARFLAQSLQNVDDVSWIEGICAFPATSIGEIDGNYPNQGIVRLRKYWSVSNAKIISDFSEGDAIEKVRSLVDDAIRLRLQADVKVGVAVSGGLDSSIIAARSIANAEGCELFSAVNPGHKDDESKYVNLISQHINKSVHLFDASPKNDGDFLELLKQCIRYSDGPVTSFSSLLFYKLMENAHELGVKVILTGQGADEAFCGYRKFPILEVMRLYKSSHYGSALKLAVGYAANGAVLSGFKLAEAKRYYSKNRSSPLGEAALDAFVSEPLSQLTSLAERQWLDLTRYSVPYLCHYEDRMSMAWSVETRSPFLDYRVVELGLGLPGHLKLKRGWTKYTLRRAFERELAAPITWRKDKKGFVNPQDEWMKGILRNSVLDIMGQADAQVYKAGLVDRERYLALFDAYCKGRGNIWFREVFAPFSLELWIQSASDIKRKFNV